VLVTYLNQDDGGSIQSLTDINGVLIHPELVLPALNPVQYYFPVSSSSIEGGSLRLDFNGVSGLRAVVCGIFLLKEETADLIPPAVSLESPVHGSVLPRKELVVSGTASDGQSGVKTVEVGIQKTGEEIEWYPATSLGSTGNWSYLWSGPEEGEYTLRARAMDRRGNHGEAAETPVVTVDGSAPSPVTGFYAQSLSGAAGIIRATWVLSADDGAGDNDVERYGVYRTEDRLSPYGLVGQVGAGVWSFDDPTAQAGVDYFYYVRCMDHAGNYSDSTVFGPVQATGAEDTTPPEDVTGLSAAATQVSGADPSVFLTWTGSADTDGDLVDQLLYVSRDGVLFGNNNPAYDNGLAYSLGRSARSYQETGLEAGLEYTFRITTIDEVPNESAGASVIVTPTGAETEAVTLAGALTTDTVLKGGVYVVSPSVTVPAGVTLTIQPGTIIKFLSGQNLEVQGTLFAVGEEGRPVVFTAYTDDEFGGDTNGDGPSAGAAGYWDRIFFSGTAGSWIERCVVRYGGSAGYGNIYLYQSDDVVRLSEVSEGSSYGVYTRFGSPLLEGNEIRNNGSHGIYHNYGSPVDRGNVVSGNASNGINAQDAAPTIENNTITGNSSGYGIYFNAAADSPQITGNTVSGNLIPILVPASAFPDDTNAFSGNTRNYIGIRGNSIQRDTHLRVWNPDTPDEISTYVVYSGDITVPMYMFMEIDAGAVVKFASQEGITVNGALICGGTLEKKIVFTSIKDDTFAGDTNNDGSDTVPINGDWDGITFNDSYFESSSLLSHVKIRYAGANGNGAVHLNNADILVQNSEISNSSSNGIRVYRSSPTLRGNSIWGNSGDGVRVEQASNAEITFNRISTNLSDGVEVLTSSNALATNNQIFMNRGYGIRNITGNLIDATQNWWGDSDESGPYHPVTNPTASGNQVSDDVDYSSYKTEVATEFSYRNYSASAGSTYGSMAPPDLLQGTLSDEWDPVDLRPDRTIAYDEYFVIMSYTGLDSGMSYKLRVSYFNADPSGSLQSLTDGSDNPIHGSMVMPASQPVQYEFSIPSPYYESGNLTLKFVHDNPTTSVRCVVPEVWLMEDIPEITPPRFLAVEFNDIDGSGSLTVGDEYYFRFSEEMDTALLVNGTTDANDRLQVEGGLVYGTVNQSRWTADKKTVIVTLTEGFTVSGNEPVTPAGLTDLYGNAAAGTQNLTAIDSIEPALIGLDWVDADASGSIGLGDQYIFHFNEAMDVSVIQSGTQDANVHLRPSGGLRYGNVNTVVWSAGEKDLSVTVTEGFNVLGDELVFPSSYVADVAGNSVTGFVYLLGRDKTPPEIISIIFDDADGSGSVTIGDRYFFSFNEPMAVSSVSNNTTEANENLSPEGKEYGSVNHVSWNVSGTECVIWITAGYTVSGNELVDPSNALTDKSGNPVSNTGVLTLEDTIPPLMTGAQGNYVSPLSAVDNYRVTVKFNSSMNAAVEPLVEMAGSGGVDPVVPPGGTWLTSYYPNDTYVTPDIELSAGMDGQIQVDVSGGMDAAGNTMAPVDNALQFLLDATPPESPVVSVVSADCDSALLSWDGYVPPADLAGFEVYKKVGEDFSSIEGLSASAYVDKTDRSYELTSLDFNTAYYVAIVAQDSVGNKIAAVDTEEIYIEMQVPPQVGIKVDPGADPDSAMVSWHGYDTTNLCGFAGFRLYYEEFDFTSVGSLSPKGSMNADVRELSIGELDRFKTYYFAVVGYNSADELNPEVVTGQWTDPYVGEISSNITIGGGDLKEITVYQMMVVTSGAVLTIEPGTTLFFASGAGIAVQSGAMVAEGTALHPVVLTSVNDTGGSSPAPGDWDGITIGSGGSGSVLRHVFVKYGQGLSLDGSSPTVEALSALHNAPHGLVLRNGAVLSTSEALLMYNGIGARTEDSAQLAISGSVIKLNASLGAATAGGAAISAEGNWWGAIGQSAIASMVDGNVDFDPYLSYEPLLTPAIGTADGKTRVGTRDITLRLACRTAEEMRVSEDSIFQDVFFDAFSDTSPFTLSPGGGDKTVFAQFRSSTGTESFPVSVLITYVAEGPVIQLFSLSEGQVIHRPLTVTGEATAALGMDKIEFFVDDILEHGIQGESFSHLWDVRGLENRIHRVKLVATDQAGNFSVSEKNVSLDITPPPPPVITEPADGLIVSSEPITVRGSAEPHVTVQVTRNGFVVGTEAAAEDGGFEIDEAALIEGSNEIIATAVDEIGSSSHSNIVNVVFDSGPPAAPVLDEPSIILGKGVDLRWQYAEEGEMPSSFRVYRHDSFFTDSGEATLISDDYRALRYVDTEVSDGTRYYGVVGLDEAGNVSALSNVMEVEYDGTSPSFGISYDRASPIGVCDVGITVLCSEKLYTIPALTITPFGSRVPEAVALTEVNELTYSGVYQVAAETPSGVAGVHVSGRDIIGNSFSGAPSGADLVVDTDGPVAAVSAFADEPVQVHE